MEISNQQIFFRRLSKLLVWMTLGLIFLGALVKSTDSGLSVPDWPTTYGYHMFSFPIDQWVGGIKYEHSHRLFASLVGLIALIQCILLIRFSKVVWIKRLSIWSVILVIIQGVLGGLTVKHFLPASLSTLHGVAAQTFFLITILIAYGQSLEHAHRRQMQEPLSEGKFVRFIFYFLIMVYVQLILGNLMRHTESGLAIGDFPTMGGTLFPNFSKQWLNGINTWRFEHNLEPVRMGQVHIHLTHRFWAFLIVGKLIFLNILAYKNYLQRPLIIKTLFILNLLVGLQFCLGIATVLFLKEPVVTSFHVLTGALVLGFSFLLLLRASSTHHDQFSSQMRRSS